VIATREGAPVLPEPGSTGTLEFAIWNAFPASTNYFAPSASTFMINYAVDDMDAVIARLRAKGVEVLKREDNDPNGRFAWILDPEGNKVELWEPKR